MEFYRFWRIFLGHRWVLIGLPLVSTLVALAVTYVLPEQYESTSLVLVRPYQDINFNSSPVSQREIADLPVTLSAPIDALSKTYIQVIASPAVAVKIVDALQLQNKPPKQYTGLFDEIKAKLRTSVKNTIRTLRNYFKYGRDIPVTPFDLAVEDIEKNLVVTAIKDTYAFNITDRSSDPAEAAAVANKAAEIFVQHSSEGYRSESTRARQFIDSQLDQSRRELEQARDALLAYKNSGETFDLTSEYDDKLKDISALQDTLDQAEGKLAGLRRLAGKFTPSLIAQKAEVATLKQQIAVLRGQIATYPQKEKRLNALKLNEHLAEESYEFFRKQDEEARVKESDTVAEIRIASVAVPSLYPVKPLKYMYAGLGFVTALVTAIGLVLVLESMEPRVRTIRDLDDELGLPVLGAIPRSVPAGR